ncbi:hypothetical protein BO82DRAFT_360095 [Aspergillus uvarum CBS 121591]|uniref:Uncharacterized protein n=2 Tax=Aspergillus subgen. Circumdati TaxID=2720871 RepID=A0A319CIV3_9EURO|nr:hypothetical protein BO82DRAFT_360095 [Aspergillus uvarum CBS 121591]PYH75348.1 hypothetical protein BO82DRAFT_360095 [Aspergillus uvarum CBS 121591]PYH99193.1 hypothetical protein BO71DRAFT_369486 [Aspergillus ellipticus CBS 707.79]
MAVDQFYSKISVDVERNDEILEKAKELDAQFQEPGVEIDSHWTPYTIKVVQGIPVDRLVVFRPHESNKLLGCIRVYRAGTTTKLWDVFETDGIFIGKVPKDCAFEAMLVQVKMLTLRNHES